MRRVNLEDKKIGEAEVETKETETVIDASNCPEKELHSNRLNRRCSGCGTVIPGHGM